MSVAVKRLDWSASELRQAAKGLRDATQVRRVLALALVLEGASRTEAATACGMDRQTLRDWVHRYNAEGIDGLIDREAPGRPPRLTPAQEAELKAIVLAGPDLARDGVDVAIRVRPPPLEDSDLVVRVLARRIWCTAASPALLKQMGTPKVPADLAMMPTVDLASPAQVHAWEYAGPEEVTASVHHRPRLVSDDMIALRSAAVAGVGVLMLPRMMITDELASGALVPILPQWQPRHGIVHAVFPSRRGLLPAVRALIDYLAERFDALQEP